MVLNQSGDMVFELIAYSPPVIVNNNVSPIEFAQNIIKSNKKSLSKFIILLFCYRNLDIVAYENISAKGTK